MLKKINKDNLLLKVAKISGMLFYFLVSVLIWVMSPKNVTPVNTILYYSISEMIAGYISITLLFFLLNIQNRKTILSKKAFMILILPSCYILSVLMSIWTMVFYNINKISELSFNYIILYKGLGNLILIISFAGLYYLISYWLNLKKQKEMTLVATNLANEAQLQMLRYQINPHFLFNALNTIRFMVDEDKAVARNMITELSNFFRYSLSQKGTTDTFENEINAIKNYLEIQKIRFEDELIVIYDIEEKLFRMKIPFFIILPLVENAIKFGLQSKKGPLTIKIVAKANHDLEISVHNTGLIIENSRTDDGTKTGIENTKKRLSLYYQNNYSFKLFEKDEWVISQIIIHDFKNQLAE